MGLRGPKPLSKEQLKMRGSWRFKQREDTLPGDDTTLRKPRWLVDETAIKEWYFLIKHLKKYHILSDIDSSMLAVHCQSVADYVNLLRAIEAANDDEVVILERLRHQAFERALTTAKLFYLVPVSRSGLHVTPKADAADGDKNRFFRKGY